MDRDFLWVFIVLAILFFGQPNQDRYTTTSVGDKALVIDKYTGEAWATVAADPFFANPTEMKLFPVRYEPYSQLEEIAYQPEDTRNDENISWTTFAHRKWDKIKNPPKKPKNKFKNTHGEK